MWYILLKSHVEFLHDLKWYKNYRNQLRLAKVIVKNKMSHFMVHCVYFHPVVSSFFFFSSPNLSSRRLHVYHTSTHGVALVKFIMQVWNMLCAARWKYSTQKIAKKSPSGHHPTTLSYLRNSGTYQQSDKNMLSSNISSTCPRNMVNFGPLIRMWANAQRDGRPAEYRWRLCSTPQSLADAQYWSTVQ